MASLVPLWCAKRAAAAAELRDVMSLSTEQTIRLLVLVTPLCILVVSGCDLTTGQGQPIIDVHLHAYPGLPPVADPMWESVPDEFRLDPPSDVEDHRTRTLTQLDEHNVVLGVLSGPSLEALESWKTAAGDSRFLLGAWLSVQDEIQPPVGDLRALVEDARYQVLGELNLQYNGLPFDDTRLLPYYALAEELGVPVGLHASGGPPGTPYFHASRFRVALGDPLRLEPVLIAHPRLRVYLQHAGHPFLERTKAILAIYPQVYVDTGVLAWAYPRTEFYSYLQALVDAGFSDRIMFGSDQVFWPEAIGVAVEAIEAAPFLTESQKRDILYDNAARFLELPDSVVQRHAKGS